MEDVSEGFLIPFLDVVFKVFKLLLKLIHAGAPNRRGAFPPSYEFLLKVRLEEPKIFKSEWSTRIYPYIIPF